MTTKTCWKCGTAKPLEAFSADRSRGDGLRPACRECCRIAAAAYHTANRERQNARGRAAYANNREARGAQIKAWQAANADAVKKRTTAYRARNSTRIKAYSAEWYAANATRLKPIRAAWNSANQERMNALHARWSKANPEKVALKQSRRAARHAAVLIVPFTAEQWEQRASVFGNRCAYCRCDGPLEKDHLKPLALAGPHILANLRPACRSCNSRKKDMPPLIWLATIGVAERLPLP